MHNVNTQRKYEAEKGEVRQAFSAIKKRKEKSGSSSTAVACKTNKKNLLLSRGVLSTCLL